MKKTISTDLTDANIAQVLDLLAAAPEKLEQARARFSEQQLRRPIGEGERSRAGILAHMLNCEARTAEAVILALLENEPEFPHIHPERQLGKLLRLERFPFSDLLSYFTMRRRMLLDVLRGLNEKQWARAIREPGKQRRESVYWQARGLALHELEHLGEIERGPGA